jgi:hypothetical protein
MTFNKNMLSPLGFTFTIKKLPEFNFFVQSVTIPGIQLGTTDQPTPFKKIPIFGDHVEFGNIQVTFKINEDLGNYIEIYNWIYGLGFPTEYDEFKQLRDKNEIGEGLESDGVLTILSSNQQPIVQLDIEDMFPVGISDFTMDSRDVNMEYLEATADFRFKIYKFTSV